MSKPNLAGKPEQYSSAEEFRPEEKSKEEFVEEFTEKLKHILDPDYQSEHPEELEQAKEKIREYCYDKYVIDVEDIPNSYIETQIDRKINNGELQGSIYSDIEFEDKGFDENGERIIELKEDIPQEKKQKINEEENITADQETTLDRWFDYLTEEAEYDIPAELRYWIFESVMKMTRFDSDDDEFHKRDDTVEQFPELNSEALNVVIQYKKNRREYEEDLREVDKLLDDLDTFVRTNLSNIPDHVDTTEQEQKLTKAKANLKEASVIDENGNYIVEEELEKDESPKDHIEEKLKKEKREIKQEKLFSGVGLDLDEGEKEIFLDHPESFRKLYETAFKELASISKEKLKITEGEWKEYDQGSDPSELVEDIAGKGTSWCITSEGTASSYLKDGDFYVYFSKDPESENDEAEIPRIGISTNPKGEITEVRGVKGNDQHLDGPIAQTDILDGKLKEFGKSGEKYLKKKEDMERLTEIESKHYAGQKLAEDEEELKKKLRFLYEFDEPIESFGYGDDPRVEEIRKSRDNREDLSKATECDKDEISTSKREFLDNKEKIKFHYGDLDLDHSELNQAIPLERVFGSLKMNNLTDAEGLGSLEKVGGDLRMNILENAEGLESLKEVGGSLKMNNLENAKGLESLKEVGWELKMNNLKNAEGLESLKEVGGDLFVPKKTKQKIEEQLND